MGANMTDRNSWLCQFRFFCLLCFGLSNTCTAQDSRELKRQLTDSNYDVRKAAISLIWSEGEKKKLGNEHVQLLLPLLIDDPEWRIKCRVISALRYTEDKNWIYEALIKTLEDRDPKSNGNGLVPLYAVDALDFVGETRSIPKIEAWLKTLESKEQKIIFQQKSIEAVREKIRSLKMQAENAKAENQKQKP
jgi:hypothetical protein